MTKTKTLLTVFCCVFIIIQNLTVQQSSSKCRETHIGFTTNDICCLIEEKRLFLADKTTENLPLRYQLRRMLLKNDIAFQPKSFRKVFYLVS